MSKRTQWLTLADFYWLCQFYEKYQPSPPKTAANFSSRYPGKLESCLAIPRQRFSKQWLYPTLIDQAAILFYLLIKNHPFVNGNKRLGTLGLFVFLALNNQWLAAPSKKLHQLIVKTAASKNEKIILSKIKKFLQQYLITYPGH